MHNIDVPDGEARVAPSPEPSRATLVTWLRMNLGITLFVGGLLSGMASTLIAGVQVYDSVQGTLSTLAQAIDGQPERGVRGLRQDMVDVDRRFNVLSERMEALRRDRDLQVATLDARSTARDADLDARLRVMEAQLRFVAGRMGARP